MKNKIGVAIGNDFSGIPGACEIKFLTEKVGNAVDKVWVAENAVVLRQ